MKYELDNVQLVDDYDEKEKAPAGTAIPGSKFSLPNVKLVDDYVAEDVTGDTEPLGEPAEQGPGFLDQVGDLFTGNLRNEENKETPGVMDWGQNLSTGSFIKDLKVAAANVFVTNPEALKDIYKENFGLTDDDFRTDDHGTISIRFPQDGKVRLLNPPGFDKFDAAQMIGDAAAFYGPGKLAGAATKGMGLGGRAAIQGVTAGATEATLEKGAQLLGSEQEVDPTSVGLATAFGAAPEFVGEGIKKLGKRKELKNMAVEAEDFDVSRKKVGFADNVTKKTGIPLFRGQKTGNRTDLERQAFVADLPGGSRRAAVELKKQDKAAYDAVIDLMDSIAPATAVETGEGAVKKAAQGAIDAAKATRKAGAKPLYDKAFESAGFSTAGETVLKSTKIINKEGKPLTVYHGTPATDITDFVFDSSKIGDTGRAEGAGFYFTPDKKVAGAYTGDGSGKIIEANLDIRKPMKYDRPPFKGPTLKKILKRLAELEVADDPDMTMADGWLANYGDTYGPRGIDGAIDEAAKLIADDTNAINQMGGLIGSGNSPIDVNQAIKDVTGYDGIVSNGFGNKGGTKIFTAFFPDQVHIKKVVENAATGLEIPKTQALIDAELAPLDSGEIYKTLARVKGLLKAKKGTEGAHLKKLDTASKEIGDMIEAADKAGKGNKKRLLTEIKTQLLEEIDEVNPAYKAARGKFAELSKPVDELQDSLVGKLAKAEEEQIVGKLFRARTNPTTILKAKKVIESQNPQAWRDIMRAHIETSLGDSAAFHSMDGNVPGKLYTALGLNSPKKRKVLYAGLNGDQARRMRYLEEGLKLASKGRPGGSQTGIRKVIEKGIRAGKGVGHAIKIFLSPIDSVVEGVSEYGFNAKVKALSNVLFDPKWELQFKKMRKFGVDSTPAEKEFSAMLRGALQSTTPEVKTEKVKEAVEVPNSYDLSNESP